MATVADIRKKMAQVEEKITVERKKGTSRDRRKIAGYQTEYATLQVQLSRALAGKDTGKKSSKSKIQEPPSPEPEPEVVEEETDDDDDDDDM